MAKVTKENAWILVHASAVVGERLQTWSVARGPGKSTFVIEEILKDRLKIRLDSTKEIRTLSIGTFTRLGENWAEYLQTKRRSTMQEVSRHTSYAFALLHRAENT